MSCNRVAHQSRSLAARLGFSRDTLETIWANGRQKTPVKICPACRNSFLRKDGGCTKCEKNLATWAKKNPAKYKQCFLNGSYSKPAMKILSPVMVDMPDEKVKAAAAPHLTDPQTLDELAHLQNPNIKAAVAANPNTSAQTLAILAKDKKPKVYQAAIKNPAMPLEALKFAEQQAKVTWKKTIAMIAQRIAASTMYYGAYALFTGNRGKNNSLGQQLVALSMLGVYGAMAAGPYRRYSSLRSEVNRREQLAQAGGTAIPSALPQNTGGVMKPPATHKPPTYGPAMLALSKREQDLLNDGLDIAQAYVEQDRDEYGAELTVDDIERIRLYGPQSEKDKALVGGVIDEMQRAERDLPGWFGGVSPKEFDALRAKLDCPAMQEGARVTA